MSTETRDVMRSMMNRSAVIAILMLVLALSGSGSAAARRDPARPAAARSAFRQPTLGVRQRLTEGFGRARPRTVSYGGDPTSLVRFVRWSSWGGERAVGHGTADWVWPGWCVACGSVQLRATVVAFDLRTCAGHPAYARVEWYFPSRGMTFSPRLSAENLCSAGRSAPVSLPRHARCAPTRIPGGRVTGIEVWGAGLRCAVARRLIPTLHLLGHLGHNARFHVGRWWCGSELSMQSGSSSPQDFSCQAGDEDELELSVSRAS